MERRLVKPGIDNQPSRPVWYPVGMVLVFDTGKPSFPNAVVTTPPIGDRFWIREIVITPEAFRTGGVNQVFFLITCGAGQPSGMGEVAGWPRVIDFYEGYQQTSWLQVDNDGYAIKINCRQLWQGSALRLGAYGTCDPTMTNARINIIISYEIER